MNYERIFPENESRKIALNYLNKKNYKVRIKKKYSKNHYFFTTSAFIENELISSGKGIGLQSENSALFEAIEHLTYNKTPSNDVIYLKSINEIIDRAPLLKRMFPIQYLTNINYKSDIESMKLKSIDTQDYIYYPHFLFSKHSDIKKYSDVLLRYKTNSGFAVGTTTDEALIHAINEIIERDSLSTHIKNVFFKEISDYTFLINKNSVPLKIKKMITEIESTIGSSINILNISDYDSIYCFFVYSKNSKSILPFKGSGSSTSSVYALERALLELLQHFHMHDNQDELKNHFTYHMYKHNYKYLNAITCNYVNFKYTNFVDEGEQIKSLKNIINLLKKSINKKNYQCYYNSILDYRDVKVIKVVIPGTDNFQSIHNGSLIIPNKK